MGAGAGSRGSCGLVRQTGFTTGAQETVESIQQPSWEPRTAAHHWGENGIEGDLGDRAGGGGREVERNGEGGGEQGRGGE